jgi:carbonic anhydrase/acetyltransferase-like protein (isoleucine patch superfamily)
VQDGCTLHADPGAMLTLNRNVSIGHMAMLHGCTVGEGSLIGIGAVVLNHAVIGRNCLIGANSLVTEGKVIPDNSLVIGSPGKVLRILSKEEISAIQANAANYVKKLERYMLELTAIPAK